MILPAITLPLNQLGQLQRQKGVTEHRHGPSVFRSCLSSSHNNSFAHRPFSTSQTRSPPAPSLNQRHPAPHVSLSHLQLLPCLTSCGLVQKWVERLMALLKTPTWTAF